MKPFRPKSMNEQLAVALRVVVGSRLKRSGLGNVWVDDRTWRELADELTAALLGKLIFIDRTIFERIAAEAKQMKIVRGYIEEYQARLSDAKKKESGRSRNAYAQWAAENMPKVEGSK